MTIDETMTDLSIQLEVKVRLGKIREAKSIRLGIEALKAWKMFREGRWMSGRYDLPGETKEKVQDSPGVRKEVEL